VPRSTQFKYLIVKKSIKINFKNETYCGSVSVAELHHFDAASAALAPTLLFIKTTFLKQAKVKIRV
jgi:hypothetical protein